MLNEGLSPEEAKAGIVNYLGFTPTMEQLGLPSKKLEAMRSNAGAAQQQSAEDAGLTITGLPPVVEPTPAAGATWQDFIPQPPQPAVPPPAVPPESRPGDTIADIVDKEEDQGYFQGPAETVASLGGMLVGALKGPFEFGLELGREHSIYEKPVTPSLGPGRKWTSADDESLEKSAVKQAYEVAKGELERTTDLRLDNDVWENFGRNSSDLSEGFLALALDVADIEEDEAEGEGWAEGVYRAFTEGADIPPVMLGGMAAFFKQLSESPIETTRTHPADVFLTILPAVPKIFRLAKKGNVKAAAYLKKLEDRGVIVFADDFGMRPGDFGTAAKGAAAKVARSVIEAPGRVLDKPIKVPLPSRINWGPVPGLGAGAVDLSFPRAAKGRSAAKAAAEPFPKDTPRSFEPEVRTPVIEKLTPEGTQPSGGMRPMTIGDLLNSSLGGLGLGVLLDEEEALALLAPAFKIVKAAAPNVTIEIFAKYLVDQSARGNPRIHAITREAVDRPNTVEAELSQIGKDLTRPEALASIDADAPRTRLPVGTKPSGIVRVEEVGGGRVRGAEKLLSERVEAGLEQPAVIQDLGPRAEGLMVKLEDILLKGLAESRMGEGAARLVGEQQNLVPVHMAMVRELLSGDSIGLLADEGVKNHILSRLIREGWDPIAAGEWLGELKTSWEGGSNTVAVVQRKRRARGVEPESIEEVPIQRYIEDAVARSPKAQRDVLLNTMGIIHKRVAKDHRTKVIADTSGPLSSIYQDWASKAKNAGKSFEDFIEQNPGGYHDMWATMYRLEKGLVDGSPVLFLPYKDVTRNKLRRTLTFNPSHLDRVVDKIVESHPELSPEVVRRDVFKLTQRVRNEFVKRDDLGGFVDKKTAKLFDKIDEATRMATEGGFFAKVNRFQKKALTVFSVATGGFQVLANALVQSIDRGIPLSAMLTDFVKEGVDFVRYEKGKRFSPAQDRFFRSVKKTNVLDTDQLKVETRLIEGKGIPGKIAKPFETFYRYGDVLAKLSEIRVVYNRVLSDLKMLKDGDTATLMVDSNKAIQLKRVDGEYFRDGQRLSLDDISDIAARGAAMAAENKFFNYFDTGLLSTTLRGAPLVGPGSLFFTWFSKALYGRRGGLTGNVLMGEFSPIVDSSSTALMAKQLKDSMAISARRAAFSQVGEIEDRARRDAFREMASYHNIQTPMLMSGPIDDEGIAGIKALQNVDLFGPFNMAARAVGGTIALARGDTKLENIQKIKKRIKDTTGDSSEDKRRMSLAIKQLSGRGLNSREMAEFVGLAGGPLLEFVMDATSGFKDKYGNPMTTERAAMKFGASLMGSTLFHSAQAARAIISEKGLFDELPERVKLDPELRETAMRFGIRQVLRFAYTPTRVESRSKRKVRVLKSGRVKLGEPQIAPGKKGSIDWHVDGFEKALKSRTSRALKKEAERFKRAGIARMVLDPRTGRQIDIIDKLLDDAAEWDFLIDDEVNRLKDRLTMQSDADAAERERLKRESPETYGRNRERDIEVRSREGLEPDPDSIFLRYRPKRRRQQEDRPGDRVVE